MAHDRLTRMRADVRAPEKAAPGADADALARAAAGEASIPAPVARTMLPALQRTVGNAATGRLIGTGRLDRAPLTLVDKEMNLKSPRYAGDRQLEAAYDNSPGLRKGKRGEGVAKVQQGLVDDGFPMPISLKSGSPDGVFGRETKATVEKFQAKYGLGIDGAVGRETMGKLDELAGGAGPKPKPPEPTPEIPATEEAMGRRVKEGMARANTDASPTSGIWYDYNYFAEHKKDPANYPWDDNWRSGLANPEYFERIDWMDWRLRPGKSASEGIKAWLRGLTIAECLTAIIAIEIDTLRAAIGDAAFDEQFGSAEKPVPEAKRLRVKQGTAGTPVEGKFKRSEAAADPGTIGDRPLKEGDWVYFYNHAKYLLKHPGGAWQGENAVYMGKNPAGKQIFSGLGASDMTEDAMLAEMERVYNLPRDGDDYHELVTRFVADAPEVRKPNRRLLDHEYAYTKALYEKYKDRIPERYREETAPDAGFPDRVSRDDILNDVAEIDGKVRKGGFYAPSASRLDPDKVAPSPPPL